MKARLVVHFLCDQGESADDVFHVCFCGLIRANMSAASQKIIRSPTNVMPSQKKCKFKVFQSSLKSREKKFDNAGT